MNSSTAQAILDISLYCTNLQEIDIHAYNDSVAVALIGRNPHLRRISLHDCLEGTSQILHRIVLLCPGIETIEIHSVLSPLTVQLFLGSAPSTLQKLIIPQYNPTSTWQSIIDILTKCSFLRELHVGMMPFSYKDNGELPAFPQLVLFRAETAVHAAYRLLEGLARLVPNIQTLMCGMNLVSGYPSYSEHNDLWKVVLSFPHLRQFADDKKFEHLLRAHPLPPMTVACLPGAHYLLEELYCKTYTYKLSQLVERCPALRGMSARCVDLGPSSELKLNTLHVHGLNLRDSDLLHLSGLERLEIECGSMVSDKSMCYIALRNPMLKVLKVIQSQSAAKRDTNKQISAEGLWDLLQRCPHLQHITYVTMKARSGTYPVPDRDAAMVESGADLLLQKMCKARYPQLKQIECSIEL